MSRSGGLRANPHLGPSNWACSVGPPGDRRLQLAGPKRLTTGCNTTGVEHLSVEVPTIRGLCREDLSFAARLHKDALPHGFFPQLGNTYLRFYYRCFVASPYGVALIAEIGGVPAGVLVGVTDGAAHQRYAIRRGGPLLALLGGFAMLKRPRLVLQFLGGRVPRYLSAVVQACLPSRSDHRSQAQDGVGPIGALAHLAVLDKHRGRGVGSLLVDSFVDQSRRAGTRRLELLTLEGEGGAADFYQRLGWRPVALLEDYGTRFVRLCLDLA